MVENSFNWIAFQKDEYAWATPQGCLIVGSGNQYSFKKCPKLFEYAIRIQKNIALGFHEISN